MEKTAEQYAQNIKWAIWSLAYAIKRNQGYLASATEANDFVNAQRLEFTLDDMQRVQAELLQAVDNDLSGIPELPK